MSAFEIISILCVTIVGFQLFRLLLKLIYSNVIPILNINSTNLKEMGKWAVVTGATDGLGKSYANILAKEGLSVVLISRTQSKLDQVASEIENAYKVETKTIAVDFTGGQEIYHTIDKNLQGMDIGVLINNVGMSYSQPEYFLSRNENDELFKNIITCNINSVINMCKIVMPGMVEKKRGVVVNVSSASALIPSPLLTVYAASKAFVDKFSLDLGVEYSKCGIIVQSLLPGFVATKMSKIHRSTWMAPTPDTYVKEAIKTIGLQERTTGYFSHSVMVGLMDCMEYVSPKFSRWFLLRGMENIRRRALKRASTH